MEAVDQKDALLFADLLALLEGQVDYTRFFRSLCQFEGGSGAINNAFRDQFIDREAFDAWALCYRQRLQWEDSDDVRRRQRMQQVNPKFILRNYLAEQAIRKAEDDGDYSEVDRLLELLRSPCDEQEEFEAYAAVPSDWAQSISVSCSS
jgi:uncharacterized protein YdiU (UPF0061 family)